MLEYLVDLNGTQAAIRAGFAARSANVTGSQLLAKPNIAAAVATAIEMRAQELKVDATYVLAHLKAIFEADIRDVLTRRGTFKPLEQWPLLWRQILQGVDFEIITAGKKRKQSVVRVVRVRLPDRLRVLELIGKHVNVKAFVDRHEHSGGDGGPLPTTPVYVIYSDKMKPPDMK
ncbi:MAG: hypothetical protein A3H97_22835 [Acidobacteria bacterium RIFCSPLOWO2_02_FULL_65_29]|nr:MAG: hypothetical protein A3H97_22835 [Acidobacteria bacterium RIFCSPLOWO2_02_FULL_65_29]